MYVQNENKDNDGGTGNIKEDVSVVTVRHPQSYSFVKVFVNIVQITKYNSMDFYCFLCISAILHAMEIFVLTKYDAHVILNSTKVHKK